MREAGMIRFGKTAIFSGVEQLFFVRKAIGSGTLTLKVHTIRFVGLPFVFTSHGGWWTDVGKPG